MLNGDFFEYQLSLSIFLNLNASFPNIANEYTGFRVLTAKGCCLANSVKIPI